MDVEMEMDTYGEDRDDDTYGESDAWMHGRQIRNRTRRAQKLPWCARRTTLDISCHDRQIGGRRLDTA